MDALAQHGDQRAPPERDHGGGPHASHDGDDRAARARRDAWSRRGAEVAAVSARIQSEFKDAYDPGSHHRVAVIPFQEVLGERARLTLWLLMGAAAFVMIISAANVANLTLMRGVRREHELVVRAALGAGVARLRRLLLVENLVLALMGAALGVVDRDRRRRAAHLVRRAVLAARERDPARRRRCSASRSRCRWRSRCCSRSWRRCRRKARFAVVDLRRAGGA